MVSARSRGKSAFYSGNLSDAIRYFSEAIAISPSSDDTLYSYRSAAYFHRRDYSSALSDANQAIQLNPRSARNYGRLGAAYFGLGNQAEAVKAYEKGLRIEPGNESLKSGLEKVLKKQRRRADALKEKEDGNAVYKKKDFETAILHYNRAMELDDGDICYIMNRAAAYLEMGKYDECIRDCDKAVKRGRKLHSDSAMIAKALTRKGTALVKLAKCSKDFKTAIEIFQKALTEHHNPDTLKKLNEAEKAKKDLEQRENFDSNTADVKREKANVVNVKKVVQRSKSNSTIDKGKNIICLDCSDDDDCVIIDPPELTRKQQLDDLDPDGEVVVTGCKGDVALRDFPHPRHDCGNFPFESTAHESYCSKCFCYVCEIAAPCPLWSGTKGHCNISTKAEKLDATCFPPQSLERRTAPSRALHELHNDWFGMNYASAQVGTIGGYVEFDHDF